jgi:hypothetical protein
MMTRPLLNQMFGYIILPNPTLAVNFATARGNSTL